MHGFRGSEGGYGQSGRAYWPEEKKGSIREGMDADFVVLDGNPLADIGNVRKVGMVFQGTNLYDEETIRAYGSEAGSLKKEEIEFIHW